MEDPWYDATTPADTDMYVLSVSLEDAPDQAEYIEILFEKGNAIGLKHGHSDYTTDDLSTDLGVAGPRYGSRALPTAHDGQAWSLMT